MKLDVPLVRQKKDSVECGLACLEMILSYYGEKTKIKDLRNEIKVYDDGIPVALIGSYLLKKGYGAEIVTLNPYIFTLKNSKSIENCKEYFKKLNKEMDRKRPINRFISFLERGGEVIPKIPDEKDIREEISKKRPLLAALTSLFLFDDEPCFNEHYNVITGINNDYIYVNDPLWDKFGGEHRYRIKDFLFGMYAINYSDLSGGSLMKITKK